VRGWLAEDVLGGLGREWLNVQLDPLTSPGWLEKRKGERSMSERMERLARKVEADVATVHAALQAERPAGAAAAPRVGTE
jgi:hypothetical protein